MNLLVVGASLEFFIMASAELSLLDRLGCAEWVRGTVNAVVLCTMSYLLLIVLTLPLILVVSGAHPALAGCLLRTALPAALGCCTTSFSPAPSSAMG